jgi:hypothetical protein
MPYTAHQYQTLHGVSPQTRIDKAVSASGTPHATPYPVAQGGWRSAHEHIHAGDNLLTDYNNDAAACTRERYQLDQGPYLQVVQSWVPDQHVERPDGRTDPAAAGLAHPDLRWHVNYYRRGSGSDSTPFVGAPGVTRQPYGWQDGASWAFFQDQGADMAEYGSQPLTRVSQDPAIPAQMPDTMRALPPQPAGGWSSMPVQSIGEQVLAQQAQMGHQGQQATSQEFTANSANVGSAMLTRMRHAGAGAEPGKVGGIPGSRWGGA